MDETNQDWKRPGRWLKDVILALVIIIGGIYFLIVVGSVPPVAKSLEQAATVASGSEGVLQLASPEVPVAMDEDGVATILRILSDPKGPGVSALDGRVFIVSAGTMVRVSESNATSLKVRIIDGTEKGRTGWVPGDWVKALN